MVLIFILSLTYAYKTIVFHGLGDQCNNQVISKYTKLINADCIEIGNGAISTIFMAFMDQANEACEIVKQRYEDSILNVIGISQGALIARFVVTECDFGGKVDKYLSIGGPEMGVSRFPHCKDGLICWPLNSLIRKYAYSIFMTLTIGPTGYYRNNYNVTDYLMRCPYLPILNNEKKFSQIRKDRFSSLERVMLIQFEKDKMIYPKETAHFESLDENDKIIPLNQSDFYNQDLLGLRSLMNQDKVHFIYINRGHLQLTNDDFKNIIIPFLSD